MNKAFSYELFYVIYVIIIPPYGSMVGILSLVWHNKFLVTLFSYTVWPTAMKFGTITGIGA